jgi:hypothetical protein
MSFLYELHANQVLSNRLISWLVTFPRAAR